MKQIEINLRTMCGGKSAFSFRAVAPSFVVYFCECVLEQTIEAQIPRLLYLRLE